MQLHEFFLHLSMVSMGLVALIYLPNQCWSYRKRCQRKKQRLQCRLCAYRFLREDEQATCPHCGGRNK